MSKTLYSPGTLINGVKFLKDLPTHRLPSGQTKRYCQFECPCGKVFDHSLRPIEKGQTSNCGCGTNGYQKHKLTGTPVRRCWSHIKTRCLNPKNKGYEFYGGIGIKMHEPWLKDFKAFYDYVSKLPGFGGKDLSIDRINNDGNYEPGNLRWATKQEQSLNRRPRKKKPRK